jgi:hypothetical protein
MRSSMDRVGRPTRLAAGILAAAVALLGGGLLAAPAWAVIYYVSPAGNDANTGLSPTAAWATIGKANSTLRAGDEVRIANGTYSQFPQPAVSGTSYANRITYVGNINSPQSVVINGSGTMSRSYVTIKGMRVSVSLGTSSYADSIAWCILPSGFNMLAPSKCVVTYCTIGNTTGQCLFYAEANGTGIAKEDTLTHNTMFLGNVDNTSVSAVFDMKAAWRCVLANNRITINLASNCDDHHARIIALMYECTFRDNRWDIIQNCAISGWGTLIIRDSTQRNLFLRDSTIVTGNGLAVRYLMSSSGTWWATCTNNRFEECYVHFKNTNGGTIEFQGGMISDTLSRCVFITRGPHANQLINWQSGQSVIDHCTFVGPSGNGVLYTDRGGQPNWTGTLKVTNNIFYATDASGGYGLYHRSLNAGVLQQNHNLFAYYGYNGSPGDRSIAWMPAGGATQSARPGTGTTWYQTYGNDGNSKYGSPRFADSTFANFNPTPLSGSLAIGMASDGGDVGAIPFGAGAPDVTAPGAVTTLAVDFITDQSAVLVWTAVGDDGMVGRAAAYDLRYSTSPINAANFNSATPVTVQPVPQPSGVPQSYVLFGLTPNTTYYVAMKVVDEAGNWSPISNVPSLLTAAADLLPPAAVQDLTSGF